MKIDILKFIAILTIILVPLSLLGQDKTLGVSLGFTYSNILSKGDTGINRFPLFAYTQSLTGSFQISNKWFLSLGIRGEKKGYKIQFYKQDVFGNEYGDPHYVSQELEYLTIPLLINFQTNKKLKFYTGFGANISFLINAVSVEPWLEMQYDQNGIPTFEWEEIGERTQPITENFKRMDLALAWQAGIRYPIAEKLIADLKVGLSHGIIPFSKEENVQDVKFYNRTGGAMLGILYTW